MTLLFIRIFFLIISGVVGYQIGSIAEVPWVGVGWGCLFSFVLIVLEFSMHRVSVRGLSSMVFGLVLGMVMAKLLTDVLSLLPLGDMLQSILRVVLTLIFSYLGAVMAMRGKDTFHLIIPYVRFQRQDLGENLVLLDTSAIIDGRVADLCKTRFLEVRLVVPRFVLQELQKLADSEDVGKRERARRGIEILRAMQKDPAIDIRVHEEDIIGEDLDVDAKLVRLAKVLEAKICTTDFNLDRIAEIQEVKILNINALASVLKSVVVAGEELEVKLVKEGKEMDQAVAYLDDGTMVVVADGRKAMGKKVKVSVSSALQTQSGRMVFAKLIEILER